MTGKRFVNKGKDIFQYGEWWCSAGGEHCADVIATALDMLLDENEKLKNENQKLDEKVCLLTRDLIKTKSYEQLEKELNRIKNENEELKKENQELRMSPRVDVNEIESLICENQQLQNENEQLKSKNRGLQSELQIFKEDVTHSNLQINKLADENEKLNQLIQQKITDVTERTGYLFTPKQTEAALQVLNELKNELKT